MMNILFVTDYVCPYCLVAKTALEEALKETGTEASIQIQPFELTREPRERVDVCHDEKRKSHYKVLVEPAKALGLDMKMPPAVCPRPYTRLAFEGLFFAKKEGLAEVYSDLVYRAYFEKEQDIGDLEVLCAIAKEAGLDAAAYRQALEDGTYRRQEEEAADYSGEVLKVTGVPTIYIDGRQIAIEHYTKEEMVQILKEGQTASIQGMSCGIDGCN